MQQLLRGRFIRRVWAMFFFIAMDYLVFVESHRFLGRKVGLHLSFISIEAEHLRLDQDLET